MSDPHHAALGDLRDYFAATTSTSDARRRRRDERSDAARRGAHGRFDAWLGAGAAGRSRRRRWSLRSSATHIRPAAAPAPRSRSSAAVPSAGQGYGAQADAVVSYPGVDTAAARRQRRAPACARRPRAPRLLSPAPGPGRRACRRPARAPGRLVPAVLVFARRLSDAAARRTRACAGRSTCRSGAGTRASADRPAATPSWSSSTPRAGASKRSSPDRASREPDPVQPTITKEYMTVRPIRRPRVRHALSPDGRLRGELRASGSAAVGGRAGPRWPPTGSPRAPPPPAASSTGQTREHHRRHATEL